jgi:hypothetical protein
MKFLLAILIFKFILNLSSCNIEPLISQLQEKKLFLPDYSKIQTIDTHLLIRVSISPEGVKGSTNFNFPNYTNFEVDDFSSNFIAAKLDYKIRIFKIQNIILNFKKIFYKMNDFQNNSTKNETDKNRLEVLIICKKEYLLNNVPDKNRDDSLLILSLPVVIGNFKPEERPDMEKYFETFTEESNESFPLDKLLNKISHDLVYYKSVENDKVNNYFVFKDELKISFTCYHKMMNKFVKSESAVRRAQDFVDFLGPKYLDDKAMEIFSNSQKENFLYNVNPTFNSSKSYDLISSPYNKIIEETEIDPDNLVKNFYQKSSRQNGNYHLSLEDFIQYLKVKYGLTIKISDKIMINEYITHDLRPTLKNSKINTEVVKKQFDNIYEKFVKSKTDLEKEKKNSIIYHNNKTNNSTSSLNQHNQTKALISNISNMNTFNNHVTKELVISNNNTYNTYNTSNTGHKTKHILNKHNETFKNETITQKIVPYDNLNSFLNKSPHDSTIHNLTRENIKINNKTSVNKTIIHIVKNSNSHIGSNYNDFVNKTHNIKNSTQSKTNSNSPIKVGRPHFKIEPNKTNLDGISKLSELKFTNFTKSENSSKLKSTNFTNKFDIKTPLLKNEKIKYVNGSLLVISTLMVPGKEENFSQAKEKFLKIIKNEKFI